MDAWLSDASCASHTTRANVLSVRDYVFTPQPLPWPKLVRIWPLDTRQRASNMRDRGVYVARANWEVFIDSKNIIRGERVLLHAFKIV